MTPATSQESKPVVPTQQGSPLHILQVPNDTLTLSFINTLEIQDLRYDISCYGPFLKDLPRRFGSSPVLDAAGTALVASYPYFKNDDIPRPVLARFVKALKVLRECLSDPAQARSPNTLSAIYLISICQGWIGNHEKQRTSHSEALVHLLKYIDLSQCQEGFAKHLIVTLCPPVILGGIQDPKIQMPKSFWEQVLALLKQNPPPAQHSAIPRPNTNLMALSMFPEYIHYPHRHLSEMKSAYAVLQSDNHRMREFLSHKLLRSLPQFHQSRYRAAFTVISALALLMNTLLRSCDPTDILLPEESKYFRRYIIEGAELAYPDRPFGATHVQFCLVIALADCSGHPQDMARIEALLLDYQADFKATGWINCAAWLRRLFENHRLYGGLVPFDLDIDTSDLGIPGCCAMM
ncbi:hypothetical protein N7540_009687 [Penicillium herquei]|nr:hypothetical protein N7540_009687 [Penicillium herquei]